jgi:hypothetical protein
MINRRAIILALLVSTQPSFALEWYQGGDLHGSNLSEWSVASERNKLATSGDWIVIVLDEDQAKNMSAVKKKASVLSDCVDALIPIMSKSYDPKEAKTTSTALLCIRQLETNNWQ